ncbi:hypothetical protein C1645_742905 [Glomus cerebriforme]|uniref:rRNA-processing protein FYV7 n=1 Tax=Glomus cerebriforme TaxID=658196 RepID=A0A397SI68_9GLOM|nr:hypothetical protein C1645_742905 [Glomus cerebriforme]
MSLNINRTRKSYGEKAKQIKKKFIRKAKIKQRFYKTLEKEEKILGPPAFYQDVNFDDWFSVQIFDFETSIKKTPNTKIGDVSPPSLRNEVIEKEDQKDKCNKEISLGIDREVKKEIKKSKSNRIDSYIAFPLNKYRKLAKPNPFYKAFQERERIQREKYAKKEAMRKERQLCKQKREAYNTRRNKTKKKLMKRNSKGQPVMKTRIDHILTKIKDH